ncbi:4-hydroxyphenylacetate 3-monooxygenase, oxygenase component [Sulfoacidibacillus thermotolerans]|uniref:4-hydroxyphenylacetate 3-monooxygenase, oxygenase component n=1 Tax=Sulfoacidibacillus thermotolerans TaxID=1765684 RepID=A0A2U3D883_SULT2|nr:4-hydroxyphenylacetate 3-monooxygenase, oxygenase component [Sulfoacidibacillus thermotolerans]PWI57487.1 4-hydroxyphenylacetate 3-monooxygenase, oxygenase component [Sulfoacidibacillus thermotolerans]
MPARTGQQYVDALNQAQNNVWVNGEKVEKVSEHPAFRNIVQSMRHLYDLQYEKSEKMLYTSPSTGDLVGLSFIAPKSKEDLRRRREMIYEWASFSGGMMGRSPDYLNTSVMSFGTAASFFAQDNPMFGENVRNYYEYCRENDLSLTHTLIHPQANRSKNQSNQKDPYLSARIVEKNADGILVRGARLLATLGGVTDEVIVFPSTLNKATGEDDPYALAFAIPNNTPGLKFICREPFDYGKSHWDHPMGSRFDESDAIMVFDDVLVPWDRVFIAGNHDLCNRTYFETNAVMHMTHQVVTKNMAKTEFVLGIVLSIIDAINISQFQHVKEKATEVMLTLEIMKALLHQSEANAKIDQYGNMTPDFAPLNTARNWYPKVYQRLTEIIRILGSSGLMAIPTEADFASLEIGDLMRKYNQGAAIDGYDRVQLYRLAWDVSMSAFGTRQMLYEYYFFGDPVRMASAYYDWYNKEPYKVKIQNFLKRTDA